MSSRQPALTTKGLAKAYRIRTTFDRPTLLAEAITQRARRGFHRQPREIFYALQDVDLSVQPGEAVGIIGRNGAGKSTLLKILSRVTEPTAGRVEIRGRLGSLLEVGTGFHPELTGRENVYLNGAILGMRRSEIARQFDSIVEFAQVERFLETPVKRYSSGMYVRLAFAVAAHLRSEILVVDEVLAVGDAQFQKKCIGRMGEVSNDEGRTVLFVSHQMVSVKALCPRAVYLDDGRVAFDGPTDEAVELYLQGSSEVIETSRGVFDLEKAARPGGVKQPVLRRVELRDRAGNPSDTLAMGDDLHLVIDTEGLEMPKHYLVVIITTENDTRVLNFNTLMRPPEVFDPERSQDRFEIVFPKLPLTPGRFFIQLVLSEGGMASKTMVDRVDRAASFQIVASDVYGTGYQVAGGGRGSLCYVVPEWRVTSTEPVTTPSPSA